MTATSKAPPYYYNVAGADSYRYLFPIYICRGMPEACSSLQRCPLQAPLRSGSRWKAWDSFMMMMSGDAGHTPKRGAWGRALTTLIIHTRAATLWRTPTHNTAAFRFQYRDMQVACALNKSPLSAIMVHINDTSTCISLVRLIADLD